MMGKKWIAVLLCLMLTACGPQIGDAVQTNLPGNKTGQEQPETKPVTELSIPYDPQDSLNPYTVKTMQNAGACNLLFDPLVLLDPGYKPVNCLAQSVELNGTICLVTISPKARFADGSAVTAQDVVYSLGLAKGSTAYGSALAGVVSAQAEQDGTVAITLAEPDINFKNSLSFPILKSGTGEESYPIQSGRFRYADGKLTPNPMALRTGGELETIKLVAITGVDNLGFAVKSGEIDYLFSDLRTAGQSTMGTEIRAVALNNLVYLGLNGSNGNLAKQEVRALVSQLINREEIVRRIYLSYAIAAYAPFIPSFETAAAQPPITQLSVAEIGEALDALGYSARDSMGFRTDSAGRRLSLRLAYNSDNSQKRELAKLISEYFNACSIELIVDSYTFLEYSNQLAARNYDLFIGEVKLPDNMDLTQMLTPGTNLSFAMGEQSALMENWRSYRAGTKTAPEFISDFSQAIPFIPICYRRGIVSFTQNISGNVVATSSDIFYNILEW